MADPVGKPSFSFKCGLNHEVISRSLSLSNERVGHEETLPVFSYQTNCGSVKRGTGLYLRRRQTNSRFMARFLVLFLF